MGSPQLREALLARYPWLAAPDLGPQTVEAGECDRCGREARMVAPCGPPPAGMPPGIGPDWALGRRCAGEAGLAGWCAGHAADAAAALDWLAALPGEADDIARLWWVATGEVRLDPGLLSAARRLRLPAPELEGGR
jgi:hypothetical protein